MQQTAKCPRCIHGLVGGLKKGRAFFVIEEKASPPIVEEA